MSKKTTKKPHGLKITRDGLNLTFSWQPGEIYEKQDFEYKVGKKGKWKSGKVGKHDKKKSISFKEKEWNNKYIAFRIRGYDSKKKKWSSYDDKVYKGLKKPKAPSLSVEVVSDNKTKFAWKAPVDSAGKEVFYRVECETSLVPAGSGVSKWTASGNSAAKSEWNAEESTSAIQNPMTRWFRVRSVGPAGASGWTTKARTYADAAQAVIDEMIVSTDADGDISVSGGVGINGLSTNPVESAVAQWTITTPTEDMKVPSGAQWHDGASYSNGATVNWTKFQVTEGIGLDQVLFVRMNTVHDGNTTEGVPRAQSYGRLSAPEIESLDVDNSQHKVTITVENTSSVPGTYIRVYHVSGAGDGELIGAISQFNSGKGSATLRFNADQAKAFAIRAFSKNGEMTSERVTDGGEVPLAPNNVHVDSTSKVGTIKVSWDWTWEKADGAQISWADHDDAWESTDEPSTYSISNLHASKWNITGLETGQKWYVRVRLTRGSGDGETYGPWSDLAEILLTESPTTPALTLSKTIVAEDESVVGAWAYTSGDGTAQAAAEIAEVAIVNGLVQKKRTIAQVQGEQTVNIIPKQVGWSSGNTYYVSIQVTSASGRVCNEWSNPVAIAVAEELTATVQNTSLEQVQVTDDDGSTRTVTTLTGLPLSVTMADSELGKTYTAIIERASSYFLIRPDDSRRDGYEGESVAVIRDISTPNFQIAATDLIGQLDEGGNYNLIVVAGDDLGRRAETTIPFEVAWSTHPVTPLGTAVANQEEMAVYITTTKPEGALDTDVVDIYRMSADAPELIVENASYGETYVDPYPAFGELGGHRVVSKAANGDYLTESGVPAFLDLDSEEGDVIAKEVVAITFDSKTVELPLDITLDNSWEKDFERTKYLGGSVQGDWGDAVTRDLSVSTVAIRGEDEELMMDMRELANYTGVCHIRTPEGSSFAADVSVSENMGYDSRSIKYSLTIKEVEQARLDGVILESWNQMKEGE